MSAYRPPRDPPRRPDPKPPPAQPGPGFSVKVTLTSQQMSEAILKYVDDASPGLHLRRVSFKVQSTPNPAGGFRYELAGCEVT